MTVQPRAVDATGARVSAETPGRTRVLRRNVGLTGLTFVSVGSVIGSGWLFGALYASQQAGPAALISWGLGAVFMLSLALVYAELGGAYPVVGGAARFPRYSHGSLVGYTAGWLWWVGAVTIAPIELEAALQYFTRYVPWLATESDAQVVLTAQGYAVAVALLALFTVVNMLGVRWLARANTPITAWKIAVPLLAITALMLTRFHSANFEAAGGFIPFGFHGVFSAMATGGVIFAYQGFEQAVQLGGESANPGRNIPLAVVGSMLLGVVVYVLLQVAFVAALAPANLAHGWTGIASNGLVGPFASLASAVGLGWVAILLYVDAAVSPGGTGLVFTAASARISYAMSRDGWWPKLLGGLSGRGIPLAATLLSFVVGLVVFLPFPGWQKLVGFITAASSLTYGLAAVALPALRLQDPHRVRPFRLPLAWLIAPFGFIVANLTVYWSGWPTVWRLLVTLALGLVVFGAYRLLGDRATLPPLDLRAGLWLLPYLAGLGLISYLGRYDGRNLLPFWIDIAVVAVFSLAVFGLAMHLRLAPAQAKRHVGALDPVLDGVRGRPTRSRA